MLILNRSKQSQLAATRLPAIASSLLAIILLFAAVSPASAQRLSFLRNSILTDFSTEEIESFLATARETLEKSPDTKVIEWQSPDGSKRGKILPKISYQNGDQICRRTAFQIIGSAPKTKEQYRFELCKEDDAWRINPGPKFLNKKAEEDLSQFLQALLNNPEFGQPYNWHSQHSGHTAVIVMVNVGENAGAKEKADCHTLAISLVDDEGKHLAGQFQFCRDADKQWQYAP